MKKKKGLHDEISRVAYESYETRDRANGHELDIGKKGEKGSLKTVKNRGHGYRVSNV